jgi:hypothetical protein
MNADKYQKKWTGFTRFTGLNLFFCGRHVNPVNPVYSSLDLILSSFFGVLAVQFLFLLFLGALGGLGG